MHTISLLRVSLSFDFYIKPVPSRSLNWPMVPSAPEADKTRGKYSKQ
jgi:hypothetical protein